MKETEEFVVNDTQILVVEDSHVQAAVILRALDKDDHNVTIVGDGNEAIKQLQKKRFSLVLLDLNIPGLKGTEVLSYIRTKFSILELPVIIVTSDQGSEETVNALQLGANDYVTKPFSEPVFLARIQAQLRISSSQRAGAANKRPTRENLTGSPTVDVTSPFTGPEGLIGRVLAQKYRLEAVIGVGGFGLVYRAKHLDMNRTVAVKLLAPNVANYDRESENLKREAEAACLIQHPNAVEVFDVDVVSDTIPHIVMEFLQGPTLAEELSYHGTLTPGRCAEILIPVCDVLAHAHAAGVIHRDIKPGNIFLHHDSKQEVVKLLDFGTAKISEIIQSGGPGVRNTLGKIRVTPEYSAPERIQDESYDGKVDVYGLGVVAYEMLTGRLPIESKDGDFLAMAMKVVNETPPNLREFKPELSEELEAVVMKALAKDPDERYSIEAFGVAFAKAAKFEIDTTLYGNLVPE